MNAIIKPTEKLGVMLCGHGSRDLGAVQEFAVVAGQLRAKLPYDAVEYGYLEFAKPIIREGLDRLRAKGVTKVLAIPGMLFAAGHAKNDIPSVLNTYQAQNEGMTIHYGRELGIDLKMLRAAGDRVAEALARRQAPKCRATRPCLWSSAGALPTPTPTPTSPRSRACCGRAWVSAGPRPPIPASPSRWSLRRWSMRRSSDTAASSCSPTSCSPASWCSGSTTIPTRSPPSSRTSSSSRPAT